ncbi:NAD(P)-dependent dehydrogenase (short-subunit alcohol dehydrogenase family) [Actinoalloteichus hoggarensis]|nr:SDR family NAD(P)-dependent oxidoreductase [Actinoalloteichus hoggarensis]MBB5922713.1 NAD(P)-dependent dehydrogenase (short-subunit alcohol dehydrogenase family) [Actinoalloteichus hoggarensis]
MNEQTMLITGATDGLGRRLAERLAAAGARVVMHGRDARRIARAHDEVVAATGNEKTETVLADLASLAAVDSLATELERRFSRLDVLVNNAGIGAGPDIETRQESPDGIELRFAVNYLAGAHLSRRLIPLITRSAPARIVNIASAGQSAIDFDDPLITDAYSGVRAYRQSKLAQVMLTLDLAEELRERGVTVNAIHPATFMNTTMVRDWNVTPVSTVEEGVEATMRLIGDERFGQLSGCYVNTTREDRADPQAYDLEARRRLRALSEDLIARALHPRAAG